MINLDDRFYTSTEVAEILGVSLRSIYRYLEESKIEAEVQTATGRHRFTRQNIIDFLYPNQKVQQPQQQGYPMQNQQQVPQYQVPQTYSQQQPMNTGFSTPVQTQSAPQAVQVPNVHVEGSTQVQPEVPVENSMQAQTVPVEQTNPSTFAPTIPVQTENVEVPLEPVAQNVPAVDVPVNTQSATSTDTPSAEDSPVDANPEVAAESTTETSQVDWLTKFKEAAEKYKQEQAQKESAATPPVAPVASIPSPATSTSNTTNHVTSSPTIAETPKVVESVSAPVAKSASEGYYRSSLGGLKDIAQSIDKSAKKSSLPYAFTMMAGLSLHKPIKPFSVLHVYVRPEDQAFFEKSLQLVQSGKDNAQLCLKFTADANVYSSASELHGLSVVSNDRLKKDLNDAGESTLANEI